MSKNFVAPFLLRFKQKCNTEKASLMEQLEKLKYDTLTQQMMIIEDGKSIPVVESRKLVPLGTKKADMEKGEDQKDFWMWK